MEKQSNKTIIVISSVVVVALIVLVAVILLAKHNNTKSSSGLTPQQANTAKQQITSNWKQFFSVSTPTQTREKLLQNGSQFAQSIQSEFSAISSQSPSATVNSVNLINSSSASVYYTVDLDGQPVLTNEKGEALQINNVWVVSDSTLCQLLSLGGSNPSVCKGA